MTRQTFSITIQAPRERVWRMMLEPESYRAWTTVFCEGSYYEGSWSAGERIRFLAPNGGGIFSRIAGYRLHEHVSIEHLGMIENGVDDTSSDTAKAWVPTFENYHLRDAGDGTLVEVELDVEPAYEQHMRETWPKALAVLKALCEASPK